MPNNITIRRYQCRHIFTDGHRCGSPCLRSEDFCYYHHATRCPKAVTTLQDPYNDPPNQTSSTLPTPEDHSSIQHAIGTIMNQLAANALDPRRAGLLLYALQIASGNLANTPKHEPDDIVLDITLDPAQGSLAPENELPADKRKREWLDYLAEAEDGDDEEEEDDEETDEDDDDKDDEDDDEPSSLPLLANADTPTSGDRTSATLSPSSRCRSRSAPRRLRSGHPCRYPAKSPSERTLQQSTPPGPLHPHPPSPAKQARQPARRGSPRRRPA